MFSVSTEAEFDQGQFKSLWGPRPVFSVRPQGIEKRDGVLNTL
jgi:hypothetical protein